MLLYRPGEEALGCGNIAMFAQQEVNDEPLLIDCSIQVIPLSNVQGYFCIAAPA